MNNLTNYEAINKWMLYCYNFGHTNLVINGQGITLPNCFNALKDDHTLSHLVNRYHDYCEAYDGGTRGLIEFYMYLGEDRKKDLVNWVMINYKN